MGVGIRGFFGHRAGRGVNVGWDAKGAICWRGGARIFGDFGQEGMFFGFFLRARLVSCLFAIGRVGL
jgi:hypothetical protein